MSKITAVSNINATILVMIYTHVQDSCSIRHGLDNPSDDLHHVQDSCRIQH